VAATAFNQFQSIKLKIKEEFMDASAAAIG
jgi:hypothetical protein